MTALNAGRTIETKKKMSWQRHRKNDEKKIIFNLTTYNRRNLQTLGYAMAFAYAFEYQFQIRNSHSYRMNAFNPFIEQVATRHPLYGSILGASFCFHICCPISVPLMLRRVLIQFHWNKLHVNNGIWIQKVNLELVFWACAYVRDFFFVFFAFFVFFFGSMRFHQLMQSHFNLFVHLLCVSVCVVVFCIYIFVYI